MTCTCPNGFDQTPVTCSHGGKLKDGKCDCNSSSYWGGKTCNLCTLGSDSCGHDGTINTETCTCDCVSPWGSTTDHSCNRCMLENENCTNSVVDSESCACKCKLPWGGKACDVCSLSDAHCAHG